MYTIYCKLRDERNLKDADVSKATGIPRSTFSNWKYGISNPKTNKLKTIAKFFGVSVQYLIGLEKEEHTDNNEISAVKRELIAFAKSLPDDEASSMLRMMKVFHEEWQRNL